jgi:ATP-dependent phosphoenolpyruvate carboxykinase
MAGEFLDMNMEGRAAVNHYKYFNVNMFSMFMMLLYWIPTAAVVSLHCTAVTVRYQYQNGIDYGLSLGPTAERAYQNL